ncbi:MAG: HypC/HybG/HupF family hydrogenase formation chaperone [Alphaproteobacteria bacterium]|nr:HypC/HybG/HupF family hydrogenase formation chaperone [Alphaproteobacteria bacterium]
MCIGIPMQVIETGEGHALCRAADGVHRIDMCLVGPVAPGGWVMVFLGAAREVISEQQARQSADAIEALGKVMRGEGGFEQLFADLIDREPELPNFLRAAAPDNT